MLSSLNLFAGLFMGVAGCITLDALVGLRVWFGRLGLGPPLAYSAVAITGYCLSLGALGEWWLNAGWAVVGAMTSTDPAPTAPPN